MEDIGFFFEFNNEVIQLPVNPEKISVKYPGNNKSTEIIKLGDINILKGKRLASISFESFFPYFKFFPAIRTLGDFRKPEFYKDFFTNIQDEAKPCRFIVTGLNINLLVSIESFNFYHKAGDHEDAYYGIELKEYRSFGITSIQFQENIASSKAVVATTTPPRAETEISIGSEVILNGAVHRDSYGSAPGKTFKNYRGKVNLINKKGTHPYHVTTLTGGWLGWVTKGSVKLP